MFQRLKIITTLGEKLIVFMVSGLSLRVSVTLVGMGINQSNILLCIIREVNLTLLVSDIGKYFVLFIFFIQLSC